MPRYAFTLWPMSPITVEVDAENEDAAFAEVTGEHVLAALIAGGSFEVRELEPEPDPAEVAP